MALAATKLKCKECGGRNVETARFCNHCGKPLDGTFVPPPEPPPKVLRKECPGCFRLHEDSARFCSSCGTRLFADAAAPRYGQPAGFWIRAAAFGVDLVLMGIAALLVGAILNLPDPSEALNLKEKLRRLALSIPVGIVLMSLYQTLMVGRYGGTLGKMGMKVRVVRGNGEKPTYAMAFTRSLVSLVSLAPLGFGFVWAAVTPSRRGWHDFLSDTRVVHRDVS